MNTPAPPAPAHGSYPASSPELAPKFARADELQAEINSQKTQDPALWEAIQGRLRTDWTYHSNGIEGSTLSRGETHFFLTEGLTVEGKPFKDFLDAQNHAEAVDLLFDVVARKQPITEGLLKEINALLLRGVDFTPAKNALSRLSRKKASPGQYKTLPNHVEQADGTIHTYVEPIHVKDEMERLVTWLNDQLPQEHPIHVAAVVHYNLVRIHPFDDGNGRGARILMNLILLQKGYFPAIVRLETKRRYLDALSAADRGDLSPFIGFIADTVIATQESVIEVLDRSKTGKTQ